jgi:hypothetical protein
MKSQHAAMNMAMELDENGVYPIVPRIVTSALMEQMAAQTDSREMDLISIRVDDPRIAGIDWHREGTAATPPPGESAVGYDVSHLMDHLQMIFMRMQTDQLIL